jgi:hypothetical protein
MEVAMKKFFGSIFAFAFMVSLAIGQDDSPWFDMEKCAICKNMAPVMASLHRIKWDPHVIENGMLTITVVPDDLKTEWANAQQSMMKTLTRMEKGEKLHCCGFCQTMGKLIQAGAKKQEIKTVGGDIMMLTSSDPAVVKQIHEMVKKTVMEHEKMEKMMADKPAPDSK